MDILELDDIQGYIIRGYAHLQYSRFVILKITGAGSARQWLGTIVDDITPATHVHDKSKLSNTSLNIAFTSAGLAKLGMEKDNVDSFNLEFREGMVTPHRQRILGDFGASDPAHWNWGNNSDDSTHLVLMIFGRNKETCLDYYEKLKQQYTNHGLQEHRRFDGQTLPKNKEHFGFRDGISQPVIEGSGRQGAATNTVKAGEFILGYKNEYKVFPDSPLIVKDQGNTNLLPADAAGSGLKDLGKNGSFLVIRQMQQHVDRFWNFMNNKTLNDDGTINELESTRLAAKMMGRWPGGAPLTKFADTDPGNESDDNDFGYAKEDEEGLKCPIGSHLRRCNPRDSFEDDSSKKSVTLSNRHRIIRRARLYGDPFAGSPLNTTPKGEVGLLFNCFNSDISRQFELIAHTWANSTKTKNLYDDPDPIIGVIDYNFKDNLADPPRVFRQKVQEVPPQNFTIQSCPVNKTIKGLERFVTIRGGAYFFFPSITAIRYLSTI
ncbi:MAG TPA: hypothetical protein VLC28_11520 [Flavitalea sp.]|nr:hypothetical protein [Flavitalea sp.]